MSWRSLMKGDPVPWLLERSDPAVRAQTLRWVSLRACTVLKHAFPEIAA